MGKLGVLQNIVLITNLNLGYHPPFPFDGYAIYLSSTDLAKSFVSLNSISCFFKILGLVVRKPVNANPGLKVNRSINFSCIKMFFASYFLLV